MDQEVPRSSRGGGTTFPLSNRFLGLMPWAVALPRPDIAQLGLKTRAAWGRGARAGRFRCLAELRAPKDVALNLKNPGCEIAARGLWGNSHRDDLFVLVGTFALAGAGAFATVPAAIVAFGSFTTAGVATARVAAT